jgi:dihydrofolate synthase / folylpolyglutamate synthase
MRNEPKNLDEWVSYIAGIHAMEMDLGLERVSEVARRLDLLSPPYQVVTIGGTNGKGSTVAGLEAVYLAQGYKVGAFTSPYLIQLNEEFHLQGKEIDDSSLCAAFEKVESARGTILLTAFEFRTLAALILFREAQCDVVLLEVGLGGRLDAVNILDADVAVITSIAIDHAHILGGTRELIATEKAGIFRAGKPVVCGDFFPPQTLLDAADKLQAPFYSMGVDFQFNQTGMSWGWKSDESVFVNLPRTALALQNMATVLMTVEVMQEFLPVTRASILAALTKVNLPGRIQMVTGDVTKIFDVSHNPAAAELLAEKIRQLPRTGKIRAVFSMLADKDISGTLQIMKNYIDEWYVASLPVARGATADVLQTLFFQEKISDVIFYADIPAAYTAAVEDAKTGDCIVVFGSFYTVAACCEPVASFKESFY